MSDLISISCPSCGGHLKRDPKTTVYTCDYCGQQHRLRNENIEEFGRCPVCHRNDRVEKVSAIFYKKEALSERLAPPIHPKEILKYNPVPKPTFPPLERSRKIISKQTNWAYVCFFIGIIFSPLLLASTMLLISNETDFMLIVNILIGLSPWIGFFILRKKGMVEDRRLNIEKEDKENGIWNSKKAELDKNWNLYLGDYKATYDKKFSSLLTSYSKVMEKYDKTYYCHRDDCVFIAGEDKYVSSAKFRDFLLEI